MFREIASPLFIALLMTQISHGEIPPDRNQPEEILRSLASNTKHWENGNIALCQQPELLLDAIFIPKPTDAVEEEMRQLADPWVARLGDESYRIREEASSKLSELGAAALPSLKQAADSPDPEVRKRAEIALRQLRSRPSLADLNYADVRASVASIAAKIEDDRLIEDSIDSILKRMEFPTVHGQEAWILEPFLQEAAKRQTLRSKSLLAKTLDHAEPSLAESAANAIRDATIKIGVNPVYLAALTHRRQELVSRLLVHAPSLRDDSPHIAPFRKALDSLLVRGDLTPFNHLQIHRVRLIAFHDQKSLSSLASAADSADEKTLELIANAISDPRLLGAALGAQPAIARLARHPHKPLGNACAIFLITRPEKTNIEAGLPCIPDLDRKAVADLKQQLSGLSDTSPHREALHAMITGKHNGWETAEELIDELTPDPATVPPLPAAFGFR
jgi:hypothetical protein